MRHEVVIRAGFKLSLWPAGQAEVVIGGTVNAEEAEDLISLLEGAIRTVRRQMQQGETKCQIE